MITEFLPVLLNLTLSEQWFYMFKLKKRLYLHPAEKPLPSYVMKCVNKRHRKKVMFLAAVARPRYDYNKGAWFDGLIGIWEFAEEKIAQRTGTIETVAIDKVINKEHEEMLVNKMIPAIKAKFPACSKKNPIFIQLDNAGPHTLQVDKVIENMSKADGWDIRMKKQPPCLPNFNILNFISSYLL